MPWKTNSIESVRLEFVLFALQEDSNVQQLCKRYGIAPKTAYKWVGRYEAEGPQGLQNRSRRPHQSPKKTLDLMEAAVLEVRRRHEAWGGRKIHKVLARKRYGGVPAPSTITDILRRHGWLDPQESQKHRAWKRFEREAPNRLWQMDFKGHFALANGQRCHPLTVVDDHSRFAVGLRACGNEQRETVQPHLTEIFRLYGLPEEMVMDNGSPWGYGRYREAFTELGVWLIRLGVQVLHSGAGHPQTHGKNERFNRTLQVELLRNCAFRDLEDGQRGFDRWRQEYNLERPHEALGMKTPAECYQPSARSFPESLGAIEYGPEDIIRKVQWKGEIHFRNRMFLIGRAFHGYPVALRPTREDGIYDVYFCHQRITQINLNKP